MEGSWTAVSRGVSVPRKLDQTQNQHPGRNDKTTLHYAWQCLVLFYAVGLTYKQVFLLLPEQVGQLLDSSTPEQVRQCVEVPDVELVVQRTTEAHTNEVRGEKNQHRLWLSVKAYYKSQCMSKTYIDTFTYLLTSDAYWKTCSNRNTIMC